MENSYGIGVANRYALFLDDESDPLETLSLKEQEKESKKKNKVAEKENKVKTEPATKGKPAPAPKKPVKDPNFKPLDNKREDVKISPRPNADGKQDREKSFNKVNENREERNNRRNREDRPFNGPSENRDREERPRREPTGDNYEIRNRDRGERRERDGPREGGRDNRDGGRDPRAIGNKPGGPRGPRRTFDDRRGKREFDRQSGSDKTGVKPVDKRDGAGAHNWGSHKDIIEEADRPNNDADQSWGDEVKPDTTTITVESPEKKEDTEVEIVPTEEEPKELTLDEWKAQRAGRPKPHFNIRKAGEGEDPAQWKKMYALMKKEKEEESEEEEFDTSEYPQRVGRQKHLYDIDIQFNDKWRPGAGRGRGRGAGPRGGGRGGPRGGGGRDGDRDGGGRDGDRDREGGREGGRGGRGGGRDGGRDRDGGDRRYRGDEQVEEKIIETRQAPKVDDERDFPSLG